MSTTALIGTQNAAYSPTEAIHPSFVQLTANSQPLPSFDSTPLHFTSSNKMSLFSLEKRIDYHLSRIMKGHRLINFKNSIERLPTEKRICECIIEVLMSSMNLIARKTKIIADSQTMANQLKSFAEDNILSSASASDIVQQQDNAVNTGSPTVVSTFGIPPSFTSEEYCRKYVARLNEVKSMAIGLEQIIWALNSNKEHIKYIVKVFTVPEKYQRSEFNTDPASIVPLRQSIIQTIDQCEEVIIICRALRNKLSHSLIKAFISHF